MLLLVAAGLNPPFAGSDGPLPFGLGTVDQHWPLFSSEECSHLAPHSLTVAKGKDKIAPKAAALIKHVVFTLCPV